MKSAAVILIAAHLTGGTAKGYECRPTVTVDGLPIYDCGKYQPEQILTPPPAKCTFNIMSRERRQERLETNPWLSPRRKGLKWALPTATT